MLKSFLISSVAALGFLATMLFWQVADYDGTAAQLSLLHVSDLAATESSEAQYDISIERISDKDFSDYSFLNKYGEVVPYDEFEALSLDEAAEFLYYFN